MERSFDRFLFQAKQQGHVVNSYSQWRNSRGNYRKYFVIFFTYDSDIDSLLSEIDWQAEPFKGRKSMFLDGFKSKYKFKTSVVNPKIEYLFIDTTDVQSFETCTEDILVTLQSRDPSNGH